LNNALIGVVRACWGARRERFAVDLTVEEQVALITLQDRLGDVLRPGQPALIRPGDEPPQRLLARVDRAFRVGLLALPLAEPQHMAIKPVGVGRVTDQELGLRLAGARHQAVAT
jgi:hypothetical protein